MKSKVLCLATCLCLTLSGCAVSTPNGTLKLSYDKQERSDTTKVVMANGETLEFSNISVKGTLDTLLESVNVDGVDNNELKEFVYSNLNSLGIDVNNLEFGSSDLSELEDAVQSALSEKGIEATVDIQSGLEE